MATHPVADGRIGARDKVDTEPGTAATLDLERARAVLRALAEVWRETPVTLPPNVPAVDAAQARLDGGVAALAGEPLAGMAELLAVARRIAERLANIPDYGGAAAAVSALERVAATPELDTDAFAAAVVAGAFDAVGSLAVGLGVDAHVLAAVLDYAARPALRAGAAAVRPAIEAARWSRGTCPGCGALPTLSVTHGKEGERSLCCGRCATTWPFPRLRCAVCGERDYRRLGALHMAGEAEFRRAEVCETCHGYVKSIAALDLPGPDALLEVDLATAALDFVALEHGYRRV